MTGSSTAQTVDEVAERGEEQEVTAGEAGSACHGIPNGTPEAARAGKATASAETPSISQMGELSGILEALLFAATDPLPINRIVTVLGAVSKHEVEEALTKLQEEYAREARGLHLAEVAGGYRIMTKPDYAPWVKRLDKVKAPAKLSRSALESLAIIAYKQPIVRAEIEQIRGVETSGVLRTLLERKLVRIVGRKEEPGRPIMYGTTKFFLEHFGLRDLSQLPPLREFKELGESEQAMLPMEEDEYLEENSPSMEVGSLDGEADESALVSADGDESGSLLEESMQRS